MYRCVPFDKSVFNVAAETRAAEREVGKSHEKRGGGDIRIRYCVPRTGPPYEHGSDEDGNSEQNDWNEEREKSVHAKFARRAKEGGGEGECCGVRRHHARRRYVGILIFLGGLGTGLDVIPLTNGCLLPDAS
mgnify:CR=1 FL=1